MDSQSVAVLGSDSGGLKADALVDPLEGVIIDLLLNNFEHDLDLEILSFNCGLEVLDASSFADAGLVSGDLVLQTLDLALVLLVGLRDLRLDLLDLLLSLVAVCVVVDLFAPLA